MGQLVSSPDDDGRASRQLPLTEAEVTAPSAALTALAAVRAHDRDRRRAWLGAVMIGVVIGVSAVSAPLRDRLSLLLELLPFPLLHAAAATTVLVACALMMTGRGLRHGHRISWLASLGLLLASVVLNLVKGLDIEEGLLSALLAVWLITKRQAFTVLPNSGQVRRAVAVAVASVAGVLGVTVGLTMTMGREHHPRLGESARAAAERLGGSSRLPLELSPVAGPLLAVLGIGISVTVLWILLSPKLVHRSSTAEHLRDREHARRLVNRHGGDSLAYFALRDDKDWFFAADSVVAYALRYGVCLVSPDPIGPASQRFQVWADFMSFATARGWPVAVIAAGEDLIEVYRSSGLHATYLGNEAIVDVAGFSLAGKSMKGLRQAVGRVERSGVTASFYPSGEVPSQVRRGIETVAELSRRGSHERGFSMTLSRLFDPADTGVLVCVATRPDGRVLGFIQWVPAAALPGLSLDVMRRETGDDVPNGVLDFLIVKTIERVAAEGGRGLGLNFAVLRTTRVAEPSDAKGHALRAVLDVVSKHAQLDSLASFNEKYRPRWVPRYVMRGDGGRLVGQALAVARAEGLVELPTPAFGGRM
jgi:lysyl-tRNA synthetase class 2